MKMTIIAKQNLTVNSNGKTVAIAKGDKFELYGKIFAYKDVIVDITAFADAFDIIKEQGPAEVPTYELLSAIQLQNGKKSVLLPKGLRFSTISDIAFVNGAVLDISKHANAIMYVPCNTVDDQAEQERIAAEKAEQERIAAEKAEQERIAAEKAEQERIAAEKAEQERIAAEKAEQERLAQEEAARVKAEQEAEAAKLQAEQDALNAQQNDETVLP